MTGVKRYFYIVLGLIGTMMSVITILVVLIQIKIAANIPLTAFCVVSWLLFAFAVFQMIPIRKIDQEKGDKS